MSYIFSHFTGYSSGNASDQGTFLAPRSTGLLAAKKPIIFCHAYSGANTTFDWQPIDGSGNPNLSKLVIGLVEAGYPVFSPNMDGMTWGNATAVTRLGEAITYAQGTLGCKSGSVIFMGPSMGHMVQCNYAKANPANVAAIIGLIPVNDMNDLIQNARGTVTGYSAAGTAAQTNTVKGAYTTNDVTATCTTNSTSTVTCATAAAAWVGRQVVGQDMPAGATVKSVIVNTSFVIGVGGVSTNATGTHSAFSLTIGGFYDSGYTNSDPARYASGVTLPMPQALYASTQDNTCLYSTVTAFQAAIGSACTIRQSGAWGDHGDAALANVSLSDILAFLSANGF